LFIVGSLRSHSFLFAALALGFACRAPESRTEHVDAIASAALPVASSASAPTQKCGETVATLTGQTVSGLVPPSIAFGTVNGKRALVLNDPTWSSCDVVIQEAPHLSGPFSGASASADWKAMFYSSTENVYIVVLDALGVPRGMKAVKSTPFGNQGTIESRDVFADGHSIFYSGHASGDGYDDIESDLLGFVEGKLVAVFTDSHSVGQGSVERYVVTTSPLGVVPPTVTVDLSTRKAFVPDEDGGARTLTPKTTHTVARWDGREFR
jgi:hypothetical protein